MWGGEARQTRRSVRRRLLRSAAPQVVGKRRKRIGKLSRGFRWRQRDFEISRAGGWITLNPRVRRSAGIVGGRKRADKLRADLDQGLPQIGIRSGWGCSIPLGPRDRRFA